jgi:hypothetical protein
MAYEKIINYSVKIKVSVPVYLLKLKILGSDELHEVKLPTACELAAIVGLLREESNTFFDTETQEILISWEPTGENDPKHNTNHFNSKVS